MEKEHLLVEFPLTEGGPGTGYDSTMRIITKLVNEPLVFHEHNNYHQYLLRQSFITFNCQLKETLVFSRKQEHKTKRETK